MAVKVVVKRTRREDRRHSTRYEADRSQRGAVLVGSPQEVIDKILLEHELFANERFLIQFSIGPMPHEKIMRSIELFGTEVAPAVKKSVATNRVKAQKKAQARSGSLQA